MIRKALALVPAEHRSLIPAHLVAIVFFAVAQAVAFVVLVPLLEALVDERFGTAGIWLAVMAGAVLVAALTGYLQSLWGLRLGVGMLRGTSLRLGDHLSALPLGWFTGREPASVSRVVVGDVREIVEFFAHLISVLLTGLLVPLGIAVGLFFVDWRLAVAMLIALPIMAVVDTLAGRSYRSADGRLHRSAAEADARVLEYTTAQPVLRAFGAVGEGNRALDAALVRHRRASSGLIAASVPGLTAFALVIQLIFLLLVYVITLWATDGDVSAAAAIGLIAVTARFIDPVAQLAQVSTATRGAAASIDRVTELLDVAELTDPSTGTQPADNSIEFAGVGFGYRTGVQVVRDASFTVPAGTTTAIVGSSGSGKTTLLRLAARFYDADAGSVRIGGVDVRELSLETLMAQLSPVFQDVYLFNQTIEENIRVGRPGATVEEVREVARIAAVDEIVERLPDGWQTVVGERGANLSGGERQRISIARALLKNAPIVLLDEATSALDPHNEAVVVRGLRELVQGKTVVVVAHKLSTVTHADQILVVDDGGIVDRGTHAELSGRPGRYADFVHQRDRARGWRLTAAR
ncbi:ABC transporter ATP-binding protein [Gordonia soli]|uniref:Putative ABC transporter permease/ATP-binding protein n=1 Tax=Gordonia soli NBRC 108243 TaxID=1223545 RepID=M0QS15_9ACTN|nr:ABC transporter ATP-binding protein [Gordonia soli]GAC70657.1 putative ABC transporter permease/ATP-binding protein [Gordonia soli NBRC 108243]